MSLALLLGVSEAAEEVKPLSGRSILITLAIILAIVFAIALAGFGYFSPSNDEAEKK